MGRACAPASTASRAPGPSRSPTRRCSRLRATTDRFLRKGPGLLRAAGAAFMATEEPAMLTQIYEVSTPEEAQAISAIGVAHIGILVGRGEFPRELPLEEAAEVAAAVLPPAKVSTLFLTADLSLIEDWAARLGPSIVHQGFHHFRARGFLPGRGVGRPGGPRHSSRGGRGGPCCRRPGRRS